MKNPETVRAVRGIRESFKMEDESSCSILRPLKKSKSTIRKDAKVLQFLKRECQRTGAGAQTLQKVFTGLLSVHNRWLDAFAEAIKKEADE